MDIKTAKDGAGRRTHNILTQWVILGVSLFVIGGISVYHIYDDHRNVTVVERNRLKSQAQVININLGHQLDAARLALEGILKDMPDWQGKKGRLQADSRLKELCDVMPGVRTILITDAAGTVIASNREEIVGHNFNYRDYYKTPQNSPDPSMLYISPPFKTVLDTLVMNVTKIVPGPSGKFSGIVSASLDPEYFNILLSSVLYAPDMWSSLAHGDGLLFLMTPAREGQAGKDLAVQGSFFTRHKESGKTENVFSGIVYATGEDRMIALRSLAPMGFRVDKPLVVAVSRDNRDVYADWRRNSLMQLAFLVLLSFSGVIGLYLYQRRQKVFESESMRSDQAFREVSEELERFFDMSLDLLCIADMEGRFRKLNRAWEETLGYLIEDLEGQRFLDYVHPEDMEATLSAMAELSDKKPVLNFINRYRRKDGSYRWIEWRSAPYQNVLIYAVARDITERKMIEVALRESETKYRIVADNTYDWEFWISPEGAFIYNSPSCERITGYTSEAFGNDKELISRIIYPDDRGAFEKHRYCAVEERTLEESEFRIVRADGAVRWISHLCQPVFGDDNLYMGARGSNRDITERKKAEEALKESRETIFALINAITESALLIEIDGTVVMLNETTAQRFGQKWEELIGTNIYDFLPSDIASARREKLQQVIENGKPINFEDVRSGRYILNSIYPLFDESGRVRRLAVFGYDITERKKRDEEIKAYAAALERSNKELEQFAYVASHDLQEPLRKIASFTELLASRYRGKTLDEKADIFMDYIVDGAKRMQTLINDLLTYSRVMTRGKEFSETDCNQVVRRVLKDMELAIKENSVEITCDTLPTVMADDTQMGQLFQNLIGNAVKYHGKEPPKVHISAEKKGGEWIFSVRDNGIGIDREQSERIFILFQRLHTRSEYSGTGIGLAVCKKIVERHGGRIWVESEKGVGSVFYFTVTPDKEGNK